MTDNKLVILNLFQDLRRNRNEILKQVQDNIGSVSYTHLTLPTIYSV